MGLINRYIEKFTWYFLTFMAGLGGGYFWCMAAFNLFPGGH